MDQTGNYELNQWAASDRIQMEDFNSDNEKIDAALKSGADAVTALQTAVSKCGNCKLVYGTYTGNGNSGSDTPTQLTFTGKPMLVWVQEETQSSKMDINLRLLRGCGWAQGTAHNNVWNCWVTWGSNYVQWYNTQGAVCQFNAKNETYIYLALLDASV